MCVRDLLPPRLEEAARENAHRHSELASAGGPGSGFNDQNPKQHTTSPTKIRVLRNCQWAQLACVGLAAGVASFRDRAATSPGPLAGQMIPPFRRWQAAPRAGSRSRD